MSAAQVIAAVRAAQSKLHMHSFLDSACASGSRSRRLEGLFPCGAHVRCPLRIRRARAVGSSHTPCAAANSGCAKRPAQPLRPPPVSQKVLSDGAQDGEGGGHGGCG